MTTPSFTKVDDSKKDSETKPQKIAKLADEMVGRLYGQPLDNAGIVAMFRSVAENKEAEDQIERIRRAGCAFSHVIAANTRRNEAQRDAIRAVLHATLVAEQAVRMHT